MINKRIGGYVGAALFVLLAVSAAVPGRASAYSPVGYPGSTWGNVTQGDNSLEGLGTQGWVRQGVTWFSPGGVDFNTYGRYTWRVRTQNEQYYDEYGPGLSAAFEKGPFGLGVEYTWLRYPKLSENSRNSDLFGNWYYSANVAKWLGKPNVSSHSPLALPLSTWGQLTYDLNGIEGSGSQGWVKQGVDWFSFGRGWKFDTYAAYNWRLRTKNRKYYDATGPSTGLTVFNSDVNLGLEYMWQRFPQLHTSTRRLSLYLTWFYNWDLKHK